ncbi:MAG: type II toxin-antitoxin system VapC family toxin [Actinomycetota bacterium]|nr:type II toxin-antitoxin system VapC family toxin [Actinomycetota bacterium]
MTQPASHGLIIDTSAGVAIMLDESGSAALIAFLAACTTRLMSAASRVEFGIVVESRLGPLGADVALRFVRDAEIETVDVDADGADRALGAWRRYGEGRHRAGLKYGD